MPVSESVSLLLSPTLKSRVPKSLNSSAIKLAKTVLRDNRTNLALWDGYARLERQRGKVEEARAVYVTALSMYREFESKDQIDGPLLWRAWAEMEWEEGRPMLALKILVASTLSDEKVDLGTYRHIHQIFLSSSRPITFSSATLAKQDPNMRPSSPEILKARMVTPFLSSTSVVKSDLLSLRSTLLANWRNASFSKPHSQHFVIATTSRTLPPSLSTSRKD